MCTGSAAPGSLTARSCSSLYLWKAGFSFSMRLGSSSEVRALMSLTTSLSSPGGAPSMKVEHISVVDMLTAKRWEEYVLGVQRGCRYPSIACHITSRI